MMARMMRAITVKIVKRRRAMSPAKTIATSAYAPIMSPMKKSAWTKPKRSIHQPRLRIRRRESSILSFSNPAIHVARTWSGIPGRFSSSSSIRRSTYARWRRNTIVIRPKPKSIEKSGYERWSMNIPRMNTHH
ncbi:Uncharacterised protein [Chlamydia trachomatis]|nr:Uncharacterised protein [Chlamydia trachomatis]